MSYSEYYNMDDHSPPRQTQHEQLGPVRKRLFQSPEYGETRSMASSDEVFYTLPIAREIKRPVLKVPFSPDPYVNAENVAGLKDKIFKKFIRHWDATFVLFYNPFDENCRWAKVNLKQAACSTHREHHSYAAVDCTKECDLCLKQGVKGFPTMKLYSKGMLVNTFAGDTVLNSNEIKHFVEYAPEVEAVQEKCCTIQ